jgi:hypothetical protein
MIHGPMNIKLYNLLPTKFLSALKVIFQIICPLVSDVDIKCSGMLLVSLLLTNTVYLDAISP